MPSYRELVDAAEPAERRIEGADRPRLAVCIDTSSIAVGARQTLQALRDAMAAAKADADVDQVGGNGMSFANPVVIVSKPDRTVVVYGPVRAEDATEFVDSVVVHNQAANRWAVGALGGFPDGVPAMDSHPWYALQQRRLMQDMGVCDPDSIDEFIARGAYSGLARSLTMTQEEVIAEVSGSKLSGRSGGFFPTGRKWDFLRTSPTTPKTMVCNADEGDPGAWVNRMTMENDPHSLLEGMIVGGYACGAYMGYVYIREEYPVAFERVQRAVEQARAKGILGTNVLGSDFAFDLKVVRGAGSYVCGEESGLIASVEDARGMPKIRPPFPAASGVFGQGSNVNNVQSYHGAAYCMRAGVEKFADIGTERNPGTMMFSLSGHVQRAGCFELPFGTSVREAFEVCGGGAPEGHAFKALQPGGPLLGVINERALDFGIEPESFREGNAVGLGGGGFVFLDERACIIDLCTQFEWFLEDESCGRCTTCHGGTQRMVEILRRIQRGGGRESDIGKFRLLAATLRYSNCFHGQFAPSIIMNALDSFIDEVNEHIFERRCRAKVCKGLIRYEADRAVAARPENAAVLARAAEVCLNAVTGKTDGACLDCFVCHEMLPDVVQVVDAFPAGVGPAPELISIQPASVD
jgi:NADH:ubiquinone oxidoreductase subunit F (NADH-binding)